MRSAVRRRGISPLVAVILLIAFTLVVAGVVASWATTFAQSQRKEIQFCTDARVLIYRADYTGGATGTLNLQVYNNGKVDLSYFALLTYSNGSVFRDNGLVNVTKDQIGTLSVATTSALSEVTVKSTRCEGAQDFIRSSDIYGLGKI